MRHKKKIHPVYSLHVLTFAAGCSSEAQIENPYLTIFWILLTLPIHSIATRPVVLQKWALGWASLSLKKING